MKLKQYLGVMLLLMLGQESLLADQIHQCKDEQGNISFQKFCPPGSISISSKQYKTKNSRNDESEALPALILYSIPDCDICDQMRSHLSAKAITVNEKNIKDNGELQQELKSKTGGELRVPVLLVGEQVVSGFNEHNVDTALRAAGYLPPLPGGTP